MAYRHGEERDQLVLFPGCLDEYVGPDHPVRTCPPAADLPACGGVDGRINRLLQEVESVDASEAELGSLVKMQEELVRAGRLEEGIERALPAVGGLV